MKTKYFWPFATCILFFLAASPIFAQAISTSPDSVKTWIGLRLGLNSANFVGDVLVGPVDSLGQAVSDDAYKTKNGVTLGAFLTHRLKGIFAISGEVNFVQKGANFQSIQGNSNLRRSIKLTYVELSVLPRLFLPSGKSIRPNIFAGPSLGLLFGPREDIRDSELNGTITREIDGLDVSDDYKNIDFGLVFGIGLDYYLGFGNWIIVELRYNLGLTDISENSDNPMIPKTDTRNSALSLNIGFTIPY